MYGKCAHRRIVRRRHPELLEREAPQEERAVQRAVGVREPVRLHHVARLAVQPLEHAGDREQLEPEQAPLLQLDARSVAGSATPTGATLSLHREHGDGFERERAAALDRADLEREAGAGRAAGREREPPHRAGLRERHDQRALAARRGREPDRAGVAAELDEVVAPEREQRVDRIVGVRPVERAAAGRGGTRT